MEWLRLDEVAHNKVNKIPAPVIYFPYRGILNRLFRLDVDDENFDTYWCATTTTRR